MQRSQEMKIMINNMIFADFHIHSRFSRATSKNINIKNLEKYARIKGLDILGTGDFTHPKWMEEIRSELSEGTNGIFTTQTGFKFILQTEISLIYSKGGKGRRIHLLVLAPSINVADKITEELKKHGRVDYDGRPIFGISAPDFVKMIKAISDDIEIIPAHAWTPWFGVFGSKSGFDSLEECFEDEIKEIHAIETGLSSDPPMNWRLSSLDNINLVSNSDSHSFWPWRIGREATIFKIKNLSYKAIIAAIRTGEGLFGTVEVDPGYGKYHLDGHRKCNYSTEPDVAAKENNLCPICHKKLTLGVLHRVNELSDRPKGFVLKNAKKYYEILPLFEIISKTMRTSLSSKKAMAKYFDMMKDFNNEFEILLKADRKKLVASCGSDLADNIIKNRNNEIRVEAGYDGVYGKAILNDVSESKNEVKKPIKSLENEHNKDDENNKGSGSLFDYM